MRTALLDGDTFIFAAASASETEIQWSEWEWTLHANLNEAIRKLNEAILSVKARLSPDNIIVALSDDERFRPKIMPSYKHNRKGRKPVVYKPLREYVHEEYETYQRPTLEGDDVLGILATHPTLIPGEKVIVAIDKDLKTIPGTLYNYGREEIREITEAEADYAFFTQVLTGDSTDGYPGCPGIGPKKAEKILAPFFALKHCDSPCSLSCDISRCSNLHLRDGIWPAIVEAYEKAGLSEEVALQNARVARILRHTDYDFKKKEVKLWTP